MGGKIKEVVLLLLTFSLVSVWACACGYSREEKQRMKGIQEQGGKNAVAYVEEKYGFTPKVKEVQVCTERDDADPVPWANGYVQVLMSDGEKEFKVHISGEGKTTEGRDDYQYVQIMEDAREYFEKLLGYEIYDLYVEYKENLDPNNLFPGCHEEDYFLNEAYEQGGFEAFIKEHPVNIRIDDCINQDFTCWGDGENASRFFEEFARDYGMKAVLISYRSLLDYEKGYSHTYGRGGLLDFDIEEDGMYICSYAAFEEEERKLSRFELQEYDGMIFCCIDKEEGQDLVISAGQDPWLELGETTGEPLSKVYSADKKKPGDIIVYVPTETYGRQVSVFIQHVSDGKWWQYEDYTHLTKDKKYIVVSSLGRDASFDFAVFKKVY